MTRSLHIGCLLLRRSHGNTLHGQSLVFSHGRPLRADAWEDQLVFQGANGYRYIVTYFSTKS